MRCSSLDKLAKTLAKISPALRTLSQKVATLQAQLVPVAQREVSACIRRVSQRRAPSTFRTQARKIVVEELKKAFTAQRKAKQVTTCGASVSANKLTNRARDGGGQLVGQEEGEALEDAFGAPHAFGLQGGLIALRTAEPD